MDANFDAALSAVLKSEGGYSDNKADPGGPTNKGITLANFRKYVKPGGTVADLKALTNEQAGVVYRRQYWDAVLGAKLPSGLDYAVFDYAVNSGPARAVKALQTIVGAKADGVIGPKTLAALEPNAPDALINALCDQRLDFMRGLKTWGTFGKGWTNRVAAVRKLALSMAAPVYEQAAPKPAVAVPQDDTPLADKPTADAFHPDWGKIAIFAVIVLAAVWALFKFVF